MLYTITLWTHSLLRWALLALLLVAIVQGYQGWFGKKEWTEGNRKVSLFTMILSHVQLLVGFVLYLGVSPIVKAAMSSGKMMMKNKVYRFWTVEHITLMLIAIVLVQVGYSMAKRAKEDQARFKSTALYFTFALIAILVAIPWPFRDQIGRGLLPGF